MSPESLDDEQLDAGEVVLAAACGAGDTVAIQIFEREYVAPLRGFAISQLRGAKADVDDVMQQARLALLVAPDGRDGAAIPLLRYAGRGRLRGLVRTVILRACTKARRRRVATGGDELAALTVVVDAALRSAKADEAEPRRETTKQVVAAAWAELDADARLLLQLHHIKGIPVRKLATVYGVHAATVARRVAAARHGFAQRVRAALRTIDPERAEAVRMGFESRLSLSFMGLVADGGMGP